MKRYLQVERLNPHCRSAQVIVDRKGYTIFSMLSFGLGRGVANYYIMENGSTTPIHCYTSTVSCGGLSSDMTDLLFQNDVRQHGLEMIDYFESAYSKNRENGGFRYEQK